MKGPTERFSDRVSNYVKYRPSYPAETISILRERCGLTQMWNIADIGSGTGIFTKILLENGNRVFAVEPNQEMRSEAEHLLSSYSNFFSLNAKAEDTKIDLHSVDMITAAQAFHWFDREKVRIEFERILKEKGWVVLMWNNRSTESDFDKEYEDLLIKYSEDYIRVNHRNITYESIKTFFIPGRVEKAELKNLQIFNFDGLKGRLMSSSYAPKENTTAFHPMMESLEILFNKYNENGLITFNYITEIYFGQFTT